MTCSASTPARWPATATRPTPAPPPGGCWITTCTPPRRPAQHIETRHTAAARPPPGEPPAVAPQLSTPGQASAWLDAERANLHAAAGYAAASGRPGHAIAIPAAISGFLFARGHWDQSAGLHQAALATARQAGDRAGQAGALNELGILQRATGDLPGRRRQPASRRWSCTAA